MRRVKAVVLRALFVAGFALAGRGAVPAGVSHSAGFVFWINGAIGHG
jgi:hypothetical protein